MSKKMSVFDSLLHPWSPCTGSWTVVDYLRYSSFPTSYRPLCAQWNSLGQPPLHSATSGNIEIMASREETFSIEAIARRESRSIEDFTLFFHVYCSLSAELDAIAYGKRNGRYDCRSAYESHKLTLFAALESDRAHCHRQGEHDCFKTRLWGSAYSLGSRDLWRILSTHQYSPPQQMNSMASSTLSEFEVYSDNQDRSLQIPKGSSNGAAMYTSCSQDHHHPALNASQASSSINQDYESPLYSSSSSTSVPAQMSHSEKLGGSTDTHSCLLYLRTGDKGKGVDNCSPSESEIKRRQEQNREKSKRHRDRMIAQRNVLRDLTDAYANIVEAPDYRPSSTLGFGIYDVITGARDSNSTSRSLILSDGKRRRGTIERRNIKAIQRMDELKQFSQVNQICRLLLAQRINSEIVVDLLLLLPPSHQHSIRPQEGDLGLFLSVLINFSHTWDILLEAEGRLRNRIALMAGGEQPISDLLDRLGKILAAQI